MLICRPTSGYVRLFAHILLYSLNFSGMFYALLCYLLSKKNFYFNIAWRFHHAGGHKRNFPVRLFKALLLLVLYCVFTYYIPIKITLDHIDHISVNKLQRLHMYRLAKE